MATTGFLMGAATAAHQVEGNNTHSDFWVMENLKHSDYAEPSGIACDHWRRYEEDIELLASAGLNAYRFGIEWARVEPEEGRFDPSALEHYKDVIRCCRGHGVEPVPTLMHFSSPAWLIGRGGWADERVVGCFERYVRHVAGSLGELMPAYVCTINEANMGFQLSKVMADMLAGNKRRAREGDVQVGVSIDVKKLLLSMIEQGRAFHTNPLKINAFLRPRDAEKEKIVMRAHRAAVAAIRELAPQTKVGLTLSLFDYQPLPGGEAKAAQLWHEDFGQYLPYIEGDDFVGAQNYSRKLVDASGALPPADDAPVSQMGYEDYPVSIGHVLTKVAADFKGELLVTENGIATADDARRCEFVREAVAGVLAARGAGAPVVGYLHWALLDNFEWQAGYSKTFGLVAVDRATMERRPKESLRVLGELARDMEPADRCDRPAGAQ